MSKNLKEENYYARWSEPSFLRKRCNKFCKVSSDEATSVNGSPSSSPSLNIRRSVSARFDTCCRCNERKFKSPRTKKRSGVKIKTQRIRESLELELIGTQVEEALAGDRQAALVQHLDVATNTLEALIQHVQSLEICHSASYRVLEFSHQLVLPCYTSSNFQSSLNEELRQARTLKENRLSELKSVMDICKKNVIASERLQSIMDENRLRREDFSTAARNLKTLLDNARLSISQMEKLHGQYQRILLDYRDSRRALDSELPKIVRTRLAAIGHSFRLISEFYTDSNYNKMTGDFFKLLSENLSQEEPVTGDANSKDAQSEICQKCKVNKIDKK